MSYILFFLGLALIGTYTFGAYLYYLFVAFMNARVFRVPYNRAHCRSVAVTAMIWPVAIIFHSVRKIVAFFYTVVVFVLRINL